MDWKQHNETMLQPLEPVFASRVRKLLDYMAAQGVPVLITQGLRTWEEQHALWLKGRRPDGTVVSKHDVVTKADAGHSHHNYGLAVDLCPDNTYLANLQLDWNLEHPAWKLLLEAAPRFELAEGRNWPSFPDNPHFYPIEIPATCSQLIAAWHDGGKRMESVWTWFTDRLHAPDVDGNISIG